MHFNSTTGIHPQWARFQALISNAAMSPERFQALGCPLGAPRDGLPLDDAPAGPLDRTHPAGGRG